MQHKQALRWFDFWFLLGWGLVSLVVYLSLTPNPMVTPDLQFGDKIGHFLAYFTLIFWFAQLYKRSRDALLLVSFVAMGIALEFVQGLTGYRTFQISDMAASTLGVLSGWLLVRSLFAETLLRFEHFLLHRVLK